MGLTEDVIAEMMKENVGRSILDSGGYPSYDENGCYVGSSQGYGRAFERNKCRIFENEPQTTHEFYAHSDWWELLVTKNLYHFLTEHLEYNEDWDRIFHDFADSLEEIGNMCSEGALPEDFPDMREMDKYSSWLAIIEAFCDWISYVYEDQDVGFGVYGEGNRPYTINTYNHESLLSQVIQFTEITVDGEPLVILQVHGGCDVRGGYSTPRVFNDVSDAGLHYDRDVSVYCSANHDHVWDSDDGGHHFYWQGTTVDYCQPLLPFSKKEKENIVLARDRAVLDLNKYELYPFNDEEEPHWVPGYMFIDEDRRGYCPICGGKLEAY